MTPSDAATLRSAIEMLSRLLSEVDDSAAVEIPVAEYHRLLASERQATLPPMLPEPCPRSRIDRDKEVAVFIAERAGRLFLREIVAECERAFGRDRTPSRSSVHRFIARLRRV